MRIWLLHVGEEYPVDVAPRMFRYGYLADALGKCEHDVLRWAPTFHHLHKRQRFSADTCMPISDRYTIQFVYAEGYRRNVCIERWQCYRTLARRFRELADRHERPDIIVSGIPSLEWCEAAVAYGRRARVATVIDVRDLWPDVMLNALPRSLRLLGRLALEPVYRQSRKIFQQADAICGVSQSYLNWALQQAGRPRNHLDRVFPLSYQPPVYIRTDRNAQVAMLQARGVDPQKTICCYAGQFENSYDVGTIIAAARNLHESGRGADIQFVLCGSGSKMACIQQQAKGLPNVVLLGWVNQPTLAALMEVADVGLAAYAGHALQSLPNKVFEYMSAGLAIVSSLQGELEAMLADHRMGVSYPSGNAEALAGAILVATGENSQTMKQQSQRLFRERYSADVIYNRFVQYLEEVVRSRRCSSPIVEPC